MGQLNNAILLIENLPLELGSAVGCTILWTKKNKGLSQKIEAKAIQHFRHVLRVCLPLSPNSGDPFVALRCKRAYERMFSAYEFRTLWISNANFHYSMCAEIARRLGCFVNYYEEGLGTYKTQAEVLNPTPVPDLLRKLWEDVRRSLVLFAQQSGLFMLWHIFKKAVSFVLLPFVLITRLLKAFRIFFFGLPFVRRLLRRILPASFAHYYGVNDKFSEILVWYPERLDQSLYRGNVKKFPIKQDSYMFNPEETELLAISGGCDFDDEILYISQLYSNNTKEWADLLAKVLLHKGVGALHIKFHPKETQKVRTLTLSCLSGHGIQTTDIDPQNGLDALKLISNLRFRAVYGLTSSVLFYGKALAPDATFVSLAPTLLEFAIETGTCKMAAEKMMRDYQILNRFA